MPDEILYHYTSLESMSKIIQSKTLWLSSIYYQNDKEEMLHGLRMLRQEIGVLAAEEGKSNEVLDYLSFLSKEIPHSPLGVYGFSLTYEGDLLSQWRGYTRLNQGVCIGFNKKNLSRRASENEAQLEDCVYDRETASRQVRACIAGLQHSEEIRKLEYDDRAFFASKEIIGTVLRIKNEAFREEKEARLIRFDREFPSKKYEKYRVTPDFIIPYTELDISNLNDDGTIFEHVILGPHAYQKIAFDSLTEFLGSERVCNSFSTSSVPLR